MKTKEIEGYVSESFEKEIRIDGDILIYMDKDRAIDCEDFILKAKLIVELPEKKIEITESELNEILRKHQVKEKIGYSISSEILKRELFNNENN